MDNESIHSESEFYLYPEEQDKYGLFVFFHSKRDITLSAGFLHELEISFNFEGQKINTSFNGLARSG